MPNVDERRMPSSNGITVLSYIPKTGKLGLTKDASHLATHPMWVADL